MVRGALTLTVSPKVALAALGQPNHHDALLLAAFQVPSGGQVVTTLLLLALEEEKWSNLQPSTAQPSTLALVRPHWRILGTAQIENGAQWP